MPKPPVLTAKKLIALAPSMVAAIETYRFENRIGSEAEAIRRLIQAGLDTEAKQPGPAKPKT